MVEAMNSQQEEMENENSSETQNCEKESPSKSDRLQTRVQDLLAQINSLQDKSQELELKLKLQETEADRAQKEL